MNGEWCLMVYSYAVLLYGLYRFNYTIEKVFQCSHSSDYGKNSGNSGNCMIVADPANVPK